MGGALLSVPVLGGHASGRRGPPAAEACLPPQLRILLEVPLGWKPGTAVNSNPGPSLLDPVTVGA